MQQTNKFHYSWSSLRMFVVLMSTLPLSVLAGITMQDAVKIAIQQDPCGALHREWAWCGAVRCGVVWYATPGDAK